MDESYKKKTKNMKRKSELEKLTQLLITQKDKKIKFQTWNELWKRHGGSSQSTEKTKRKFT